MTSATATALRTAPPTTRPFGTVALVGALRRMIIDRLRLTAATIGRLFVQADESVRVVQLAMSSLPSVVQLEAVLRVLIPGGLLTLTIPKSMEALARDLIRLVPGFGPNAAREKRPVGHMAAGGGAERKYKAPRGDEKRERKARTISIWVRKDQAKPIFLPATPEIAVQRRLAIRHFGNKQQMASKTLPYLLPQLRPGDVVVSPFAGSMIVEAELANRGFAVKASDADADLINMFSVVQQRRVEFIQAALALVVEKDKADDVRALFYSWRESWRNGLSDPVQKAATSFALRRMAASGAPHGAFAWGHRFTEKSIGHVAKFPLERISLEAVDFRLAIDRATHAPLILDPPYLGLTNFYAGPDWGADDYLDLFDRLKDRSRWLLHMNSCGDAMALFAGFPMRECEIRYASTKQVGKELIILPRGFAL